MKYFKCAIDNIGIRRIVGEMINITYNITYFDDNGRLLEKQKTRHNMYDIDGVDYEIYVTTGVVYIVDSSAESSITATIQTMNMKFIEMCNEILAKYGQQELKLPTASAGSKQYMLISELPSTRTKGNVKISANTPYDYHNFTNDFEWAVLIKIPPITGIKSSTTDLMYAVSSIIVDTKSVVALPDGHRSINFPSINEMKITSENRIEHEPIKYHANLGLIEEIAKYYYTQEKRGPLGNVKRPMNFVKWSWFKPYHNMSEIWSDPYAQIKNGVLDREIEDSELDISDSPKCFMTGIPIYEDCYVFDIYSQEITEYVDADKVHTYPNAVVLEESSKLDTKSDDEESKSKKDTKRKKSTRKSIKNSSNKLANSDEEKDITSEDEESPRPTKVIKKKSTKASVKKVANPKIKTSPIRRKGMSVSVEELQVKIKYTKNYDKPKCILISPYYMHLSRQSDVVNAFEEETQTKVLVYRTFCPVTQAQVISNLPITDLRKQILLSIDKHVMIDKHSVLITGDIQLYNDTRSISNLLYQWSSHLSTDVQVTTKTKYGIYDSDIKYWMQ